MSDQAKAAPMSAPIEGVPASNTPQEPQKPATEQPRDDEGRFAQLSRKERALRQQARELEQAKREFEQEKNSYKPVDWKARLKNDFTGAIAEAGLTQEEITQQLMNTSDQGLTVKRLEAKIAELESKMGEQTTKLEQDKQSAFETAKAQVSREVKNLIDTDEAYETVRATNNHEAVVELIVQTYQEDGILLTAEEAAQQIEEHLLEEAVSMAKLKKVQGKLSEPGATPPSQEAQKTTQTPQINTLTNAATTQSKPLSARERRERAIMAFKGTLK